MGLKDSTIWRMRVYQSKIRSLYWNIKGALNFSKREEVDGISMIVVGRNDNYGGDFSLRLKTTMDWNTKIFPNLELIYIEWNRIEDRESDCDWISKRYPNSKCYTVSKNVHDQFAKTDKIKMLEYFAKNIGFRQASHDWIISVNADVLISPETGKNLNKLSRSTVYGTHYNNLNWQGEEITNKHFTDPSILITKYSAYKNLGAVVGNFILTHKSNWLKATGYDESLADVRAGVDNNGVLQLIHHGLRTEVIGEHFHLDHEESMVQGHNPTHGKIERQEFINQGKNIPYQNPESWGLNNVSPVQIAERVWEYK